jgi:hypothetical protein
MDPFFMYRTSLRRLSAQDVFLAFALLCASGGARAAWQIDVDGGFFYDSNLTRAYEPADIRADAAATFDATAGTTWIVSGNDWFSLSGEARSELYDRFTGLDVIGLGVAATYRHKFGLGLGVPYLVLAASGANDDYHSRLRDGPRYEIRIELGKRLSPEFDAAFGARYERRYARHDDPVVPGISGRVFAVRAESVYARGGYDATDRVHLGAELEVRRGDVVATTRPDLDIFLASDAIAADPTFGPDFFAYRLRGTTGTARINGSLALDDHSSLNLVYADERTDAAGGIYYRSHRLNLVYAWRY